MGKWIEIVTSIRDAKVAYERLNDARMIFSRLGHPHSNVFESDMFDDDEFDDMEELEDDIKDILEGLEYDMEEYEE